MYTPVTIPTLQLYKGCTFSYDFTLLEAGAGIDLTNWLPRVQFRVSSTSRLVLEANIDNGKIVIVDSLNGILGLRLSPTDTNILITNIKWDMTMTNSLTNERYTFLLGTAKLYPVVTALL